MTSNRRRTPRGPQAAVRSARAGFTIVELIVAIIILTIGVLGLAGSAAVVTRQLGTGNQLTIAAAVAQTRFETLAAQDCANAVGGPVITRGITENWAVTGSGQTRVIRDSLSYIVAKRGARFVIHESVIQCR